MKWRTGIWREVLLMSYDSIRSHKMRSFLTVLGIMIGVMTVIAMVSVIQGLNSTFLSELEAVGSDIVMISKREPGIQVGDVDEELRKRKNLTFEDALAIEAECSLVRAVGVNMTANLFEPIPIKYRGVSAKDALIIGMNEQFPDVISVYLPSAGRFISRSDVEHRSKICVLGADARDTLFPHTNPLGKEVRIGPESFTVVGVLEKRGSMFGQSRDNLVGLPLTTLMKYFPYDLEGLEIMVAPKRRQNLDAMSEQVINLMRRRRKVPFGKPNDFAIYSQDSIIELYNQLTGAAYMVMVVISSIGLLVGGIGVMNIMLVTIKERTREIGIRKAIGARSGDIMKQFLLEAVFLTGVGGLTEIAIGFLIALVVRTATPLPASVTLWSVGLGLFVSMSVGLFFGIFPAQKAARLDPIVSLRYE
jgi:putative ABC transport system permease protein